MKPAPSIVLLFNGVGSVRDGIAIMFVKGSRESPLLPRPKVDCLPIHSLIGQTSEGMLMNKMQSLG